MTKSIEELNMLQLDVLKEIGNIGTGNAVTALSKLINKEIEMSVPKVQIIDFKSLTDVLGGADNLVVGILISITNSLKGYIMFIIEQQYSYPLLNILTGKKLEDMSEFTEMDISALTEIGNILAGSYLSSLSTLTGLNILPSTPSLTIDMAGAILSVPAIEFGKIGDSVLFIETEFKEHHDTVVGNFFLIPDVESYDILLNALGVEI